MSVPSRSQANACTGRGKASAALSAQMAGLAAGDERRDVRDLLWLELLSERGHAALSERDSLDRELVGRSGLVEVRPDGAARARGRERVARAAAAAREHLFAGGSVARQLEGGKVGVAATRRLLRDRALDGLGRRRDLALAASHGDERERRPSTSARATIERRIARSL